LLPASWTESRSSSSHHDSTLRLQTDPKQGERCLGVSTSSAKSPARACPAHVRTRVRAAVSTDRPPVALGAPFPERQASTLHALPPPLPSLATSFNLACLLSPVPGRPTSTCSFPPFLSCELQPCMHLPPPPPFLSV